MEDQEKDKKNKKRKLSLKTKIILFELFVIVALVVGAIYFRNQVITSYKYINEHNKLSEEKTHCEELMARQSGDFDQYQYCRQLLQTFSQ